MAAALPARVQILYIAAMEAAHSDSQGIFALGNRHKVYVVAHDAVSQEAQACLGAVKRQEIQIDP